MNDLSPAERELEDLELVFKALAHQSRRHILMVLRFRGGSMTAGEIAARFGCRWPTTTRHLGVLLEAGLVRLEKKGRERIYSLDTERLRTIAGGWLSWFEDEAKAPAPRSTKRQPKKRSAKPRSP